MTYLEQRNKQIEDRKAEIELQLIKENRQHIMAAQGRPMEQRDEDREANLKRVNMHLERLLEKADKDHALLRHMAFHYMARNKVCKA